MDLLQNCDLPPPLKFYPPFEADGKKKTTSTTTTPKISHWDEGAEEPISQQENNSLLRALQLSQSRAREAEKKAALSQKENEKMYNAIIGESLRLSAHRQWVKLLEMEIMLLSESNKMMAVNHMHGGGDDDDDDDDVNLPTFAWCFTLALCLGIGFALGRYML